MSREVRHGHTEIGRYGTELGSVIRPVVTCTTNMSFEYKQSKLSESPAIQDIFMHYAKNLLICIASKSRVSVKNYTKIYVA